MKNFHQEFINLIYKVKKLCICVTYTHIIFHIYKPYKYMYVYIYIYGYKTFGGRVFTYWNKYNMHTSSLLTFSFLQAGTGTDLSDGQVVMFRKIFHNAELQRHLLRSFFSSTLTFFIYNHYGSNFSFLPMISGLF